MVITVFTHSREVEKYRKLLDKLFGKKLCLKIYDVYDSFIADFSNERSDVVIVDRNGAEGMESARNAKLMQPDASLIWFSDDNGFGIESYRIDCAFFSAENVTEELLQTAFEKCESEEL